LPQDKASGDSAGAGPEFKSEAAKASFETAQQLYGTGDYKKAESLFKRALRKAKTKKDKVLVQKWVKAAGGGKILATLERRAKKQQLNRAYEEARGHARKYAGTPAEALFEKFIKELEAELIVVLQNFDRVSARYTKKYGKTYVREPKPELDGTQCLRWTNTTERPPAALKIQQVPRDWRPFGFLEFWVNVARAPSDPQAVIACKKGAGAKKKPRRGRKSSPDGFLIARLKLGNTKGEWQRIRLALSEFKATGAASLDAVEYFSMQVGGGTQFDLLIDRVSLYRNDTSLKGKGRK
jgi:hypothetical protein